MASPQPYVSERYHGPFEPLAALLTPERPPADAARELEWKCARNPHGRGEVFTVRCGAELAALVAIYRRNVLLGHEEVAGGLNADLVVSPAHRRKGLAVRVLEDAFAGAGAAGFRVAFGFPNEPSLPAQRRAGGWTELGTLRLHTVSPSPLHDLPRRAAARLPAALGRPLGRVVDAALRPRGDLPARVGDWRLDTERPAQAAYDRFWARVRASGRYLASRDHAWLVWRFYERPGADYEVWYARAGGEVEGYLALAFRTNETGQRIAVVVDALCADPVRQTDLLSFAVPRARRAAAVELAFPHGGPVEPAWPGARETDSGQVFFVRAFDGALAPDELARLPWYFSHADSDVG